MLDHELAPSVVLRAVPVTSTHSVLAIDWLALDGDTVDRDFHADLAEWLPDGGRRVRAFPHQAVDVVAEWLLGRLALTAATDDAERRRTAG